MIAGHTSTQLDCCLGREPYAGMPGGSHIWRSSFSTTATTDDINLLYIWFPVLHLCACTMTWQGVRICMLAALEVSSTLFHCLWLQSYVFCFDVLQLAAPSRLGQSASSSETGQLRSQNLVYIWHCH